MNKERKKMECSYRDRIDDYSEGKLGKDEKLSFESHIDSCHECAELVSVQKLADRIIAEEKNSAPGFYLAGRIMSRIEDLERQSGSALIRILRPVVISVSMAAAIFAGVLIGDLSSKPVIKAVPVELTLMNDIAMESVNVLIGE